MALNVRPLTTDDTETLQRCARSRTAPHRVVQRAQLVWASAHGEAVPVIARQVGLSACRVRAWLHRFHEHSWAGVADAARSGRPRQHDASTRGTVMALARTQPQSLGLPCALWTLGRLQQALQERHRLHGTPATIWKWLQVEGLVWQRQQSWFHVTVDAALAEKRGVSSRPPGGPSRSGGSLAGPRAAR